MADKTDEIDAGEDTAALPDDQKYPPYVVTDEDKRRWDTCVALAEKFYEDLDPGERAAQVWSAVRTLYKSNIPTGDESERNAA